MIFLIAVVYSYEASKGLIINAARTIARNLTFSTIYELEIVFQGIEKAITQMSSDLEERTFGKDELSAMLVSTVSRNPEIFGSAIAYEPYSFDPHMFYFAPYAYRKDQGEIALTMLGWNAYQYFHMDWYRLPKMLERAMWSEPYYDEGGGNIIMATLSVPFFGKNEGRKIFRGIATADISLEWLRNKISSIKIYETGYACLVSRKGVFITHPHDEFIMKESVFSLAGAKGDEELVEIARKMTAGEEGFVPLRLIASDRKAWMYYAPLPSSGWSLGVIFPDDELFADTHRLIKQIIWIAAAGFALLVIVISGIARKITSPLRLLAKTATEISQGNLDVELVELERKDEIGLLNRSFIKMKHALKAYIADLAETTAAKERIESELKIARIIQTSFLPKRFPPCPDQDSFEIYASLEPAREISGDLYDFFLLDEKHLFFTVADVSGKGIPAALFMAVAKTLLKGIALSRTELSEIFRKVNLELCKDNDEAMFVSAFCGMLNCETGELHYTNAGHLPPIVAREGGHLEWLHLPEGLFLGVFEDSTYLERSVTLMPGDMVIAYTDGVTEAMNRENGLYTSERLFEKVRTGALSSAEGIVEDILASVNEYSAGLPLADDVTVLAVLFKKPLSVNAQLSPQNG